MSETSGQNKDIWKKLVKITRIRPVILGRPVIRMGHHTVTIISGPTVRYRGIIFICAGLFPFLCEWFHRSVYNFTLEWLNWFTVPMSILVFIFGLFFLLRRDSITWPGFGHGIFIRQGYVFFSIVYFLSLEELQASLVLNERKGLARRLSLANTCMLMLSNTKRAGNVMVAAAKERLDLLPALNSLTAVIRGCSLEDNSGIRDCTVADLQLKKHRMRIYKGSINKSALAIRAMRMVETDGKLQLRRSSIEIVLWSVLVSAGLLVIPCFWQSTCNSQSELGLEPGIVISVSVLMSLVGLLGIYPGYDIQNLTVDRAANRLVIEYGIINLRSPRPKNLILNFNTIAAVQICPVYMDELLTAYELNLVMISSQDRRVNLTGYFKLETIRAVARRLADEIGCQLLDHSL